MERNLLVTVSEDLDSLYSVWFVVSFFMNKKDVRVTLLYIAPRFESKDVRDDSRLREIDENLSEIYARMGRKALETSNRILVSFGFSPSQITTKLIYKRDGMVADIVQEAIEGNHQAIVLGQRGYSIFERTLHRRLPSEFLKLQIDLPIWICRRLQRGLKNVLLCIDGSPASQRITDHVACFAGIEENHSITLFHASDRSRQDAAEILAAMTERLMDHGVKEDRIRTVIVEAPDAAGAIDREADRGAYAVVAVGRRDIKGDSDTDKWLIGSNSMKLIHILNKAALWVSK